MILTIILFILYLKYLLLNFIFESAPKWLKIPPPPKLEEISFILIKMIKYYFLCSLSNKKWKSCLDYRCLMCFTSSLVSSEVEKRREKKKIQYQFQAEHQNM